MEAKPFSIKPYEMAVTENSKQSELDEFEAIEKSVLQDVCPPVVESTPRDRIIRQRQVPDETATAGRRNKRIFFGEYDATAEEEKVVSGLMSPSNGNTSLG